MGRRKAKERDVLPFPFPSPPAPAARVTRRRLGASQGGQVYFANAADGSPSFATTLSEERHTKNLSAFSQVLITRYTKLLSNQKEATHSPINVPLSKKTVVKF